MDSMRDSILGTINKMLGNEGDFTPFDTDVITFINAALLSLTELGIGPKDGFEVTGYGETWDDFLTNEAQLSAAKTYVYLEVKMVFDPPSNSFVMESMKQQAEKLGWRLNVMAESVETFDFMNQE